MHEIFAASVRAQPCYDGLAFLRKFLLVVYKALDVFLDSSCQETLSTALDAVLEKTQDFTDSAYTSHEHRQVILDSSDRLKAELDHLLGLYANVVSFYG